MRSAKEERKTKSGKSPKAVYFSPEYFLSIISVFSTSTERYNYCVEKLPLMEPIEDFKFLHAVFKLFDVAERNKYLFYPGTARVAKHLSKVSELTEFLKLLDINHREAFCNECFQYNANILTSMYLANVVSLLILFPEEKQFPWAKNHFNLANFCSSTPDEIVTALTMMTEKNRYSFLYALLGKDIDSIIIHTRALDKYIKCLGSPGAAILFNNFNSSQNLLYAYYRGLDYFAMRNSIITINRILPGTLAKVVAALPNNYFQYVFTIFPERDADGEDLGECDPMYDANAFCDWLSCLGKDDVLTFCARFNKNFYYYLIDNDIVKLQNVLFLFPETTRLEFCQKFLGNVILKKVADNVARLAELLVLLVPEDDSHNVDLVKITGKINQSCDFISRKHIDSLLKTELAIEDFLALVPSLHKECYQRALTQTKAVHSELNKFFKQANTIANVEEKTPLLTQRRLVIHYD